MARQPRPALSPLDQEAIQAALDLDAVAANSGDDVTAAVETAASGRHVLLFAAPSAWPAIEDVLAVSIDSIPQQPSSTNPLVVASAVTCTGSGPAAGSTVRLADIGAIHSAWLKPEHVLATHDGHAVAAALTSGGGTIILVAGTLPAGGSGGASAKWIAHALSTASLNANPDEITRRISATLTPTFTTHPPVPIVTARTWNPSALPAVTGVNDPALLSSAGHAGRLLPANVHDALIDFADHSNNAGALLVKGAPIGAVPPTPSSPGKARKPDLISEHTLLACARLLGQPVGYAPEHGGDLVQNVSPTRTGAARQVSTSSKVELEFHTEAAFHPFRPRYLLLLCLRGDPNAATTLCSVDAIAGHLDPDDLQVLSEPRFTTGIDESYTNVKSSARSHPRPVLTGTPGALKLWLDNDLMRGTDPRAQEALETIARLARTRGTAVTLEAGDILIVDNDRAVHGRSPFTPRFDGTDRWLQRAMVVADHSTVGADLHGRIITTEFVAN